MGISDTNRYRTIAFRHPSSVKLKIVIALTAAARHIQDLEGMEVSALESLRALCMKPSSAFYR